jgi:hypothetical protein
MNQLMVRYQYLSSIEFIYLVVLLARPSPKSENELCRTFDLFGLLPCLTSSLYKRGRRVSIRHFGSLFLRFSFFGEHFEPMSYPTILFWAALAEQRAHPDVWEVNSSDESEKQYTSRHNGHVGQTRNVLRSRYSLERAFTLTKSHTLYIIPRSCQ